MNLQNAYGNTIVPAINGRVDLISENVGKRFEMMERVAVKNKASAYCDAIKGQWEETSLSQAFFCKENIQIIQNAIRAGVYSKSENQYVIAPPNIDNLKIIMRSYFMGYVEYSSVLSIKEQVETLNKLVTDYCVKELYSASLAHINYIQDQSTMYTPMAREQPHDRNYKQLELKNWT